MINTSSFLGLIKLDLSFTLITNSFVREYANLVRVSKENISLADLNLSGTRLDDVCCSNLLVVL